MNDRWPDLLNKFLENKISETELTELYRQAALSKSKQEQFEHFATRQGIMNQLKELEEVDPAKHWEPFKKQLHASRFKWHPLAMAAAMAIAVLTTVFYYTFNTRHPAVTRGKLPLSIQNLIAEKEPILILSNGAIIKLDSVPNGALVARGMPFKKINSSLEQVQIAPGDHVQVQGLHILSVPPGRQYQITLTDGTLIKVNGSSQLCFPAYFASNERWVAMHGEAWFEVNADATKPFFVNVKNKLYTKVTGTSFNIHAYPDNDHMSITLSEGRLAITDYGGKKEQSLLPGQQASIKNGNFAINDILNVDQVTAWKEGLFHFNKQSIYEIMEEIGRWYNVKIQFNGEMPATTFTGRIWRSTPLSDMIHLLRVYGIHITLINDTLIISPKQ